ncbi:hypothetical protein [Nocardioides sp. CER19]|uniref:hypothetical protein n=1 Tax=Nocardioides sp. CER19 TaxID=3038538 RepID=UPI002447048F|nr:hypothetical protein [Nocardioides sp. CER19]MDH2412869.1 hypothetical protein [Nocardioides sp. CER19]
MALSSPHPRVAKQPAAWEDSLDQAISELRLVGVHKARALAAIQHAISQGATWSDVGAFLRARHVRIPRPR